MLRRWANLSASLLGLFNPNSRSKSSAERRKIAGAVSVQADFAARACVSLQENLCNLLLTTRESMHSRRTA